MKRILQNSFLFACFGMHACGASPLLHHEQPVTARTEAAAPVQAAAHCDLSFSRAQLCASLTWDAQPDSENEGSFVMQFRSLRGDSVNSPQVPSVQLWMPSMGHGSSPVTVVALGGGAYRVSRVFFIMPGDWEIRVQLKDGAQIADQAVQSIHI